MDDMAGAMTIHGNVFIKDKVSQPTPPSNAFAAIHWIAIFINGGADVSAYENTFLGPEDGSAARGALYNDKAALFRQTSTGTFWNDGASCGNTGMCQGEEFYELMRELRHDQPPASLAFPELARYDATPDSGSDWWCGSRRSCPLAAWNQTVVCNAAVGRNREYAHRAIWPTDPFSDQSDEAVGGRNVPRRNEALTEFGNMQNAILSGSSNIDAIEAQGMQSVLQLAARLAAAGEARSGNGCREGSRSDAARMQLARRNNNACSSRWSTGGMSSCDPCTSGARCAARDMPREDRCSC